MNYILYLITNLITGKVYVGQTIQSISIRWVEHCCTRDKDCFYLQNAIKKYGKKNFKIEELCRVSTQEELDFVEILFIQALHATDLNFGYNLRDGGSRGAHSARSRQLMSIVAIGRPKSEEHRKHVGDARRRKCIEDPAFRKKLSDIGKARTAKFTLEERRKQTDYMRTFIKPLSKEVRKRIGEINSTKKRTEAEKAHLRECTIRQFAKKRMGKFHYIQIQRTISMGLCI
jgi:group I intron endonuclease